MGWKIVETDEEGFDILTDSELIGMSIFIGRHEARVSGTHPAEMKESEWKYNVYARIWHKIQSVVQVAFLREG
jgi:hypothetical protein